MHLYLVGDFIIGVQWLTFDDINETHPTHRHLIEKLVTWIDKHQSLLNIVGREWSRGGEIERDG